EPDVHDGRGEVDVPHALPPDAGVRDLHAAAVADDALVLGAAELAAGALVVALGPEDALAEEAVLLGAVGAVVDGLGLLALAEGPGADVVGGGERALHGGEVVHAVVDRLGHECRLLSKGGGRIQRTRPARTVERGG